MAISDAVGAVEAPEAHRPAALQTIRHSSRNASGDATAQRREGAASGGRIARPPLPAQTWPGKPSRVQSCTTRRHRNVRGRWRGADSTLNCASPFEHMKGTAIKRGRRAARSRWLWSD